MEEEYKNKQLKIKVMSKEEILTSIYNIVYEQDTFDKNKCLELAEEITEFIDELLTYKLNKQLK